MSTEQASTPNWLPELEEQQQASPDFGNQLPDIRINGRELRDVSIEAIEAVAASNNPPRLFSRAGSVVRVDQAEEGRPIIIGVTDVHLRGEMTRSANFHKLTKRSEGLARTSTSPPLDAARDILSRPVTELRFPPIEAITEAPFIRPDGEIVSTPGYDAATRTFYAPVGNMKGFFVPERPNDDDVDGARALIEEALGEFPFVDEASRANAFALFITPELRPAILGNVPMGLADAPQAGSGKTLLAAIVSEKTSGIAAAMRPAPIRDDEEWRKTLTATIQAGHCLTIFDNVDHVLDSPSLALAVTASTGPIEYSVERSSWHCRNAPCSSLPVTISFSGVTCRGGVTGFGWTRSAPSHGATGNSNTPICGGGYWLTAGAFWRPFSRWQERGS